MQELNIAGTELTTLPVCIGGFKSLQRLLLSNTTALKVLPSAIGQLANLQVLDLRNGQLTTLPAELAQLTRLQFLYLEGNPLLCMPIDLATVVVPRVQIVDVDLWQYPTDCTVHPADFTQVRNDACLFSAELGLWYKSSCHGKWQCSLTVSYHQFCLH